MKRIAVTTVVTVLCLAGTARGGRPLAIDDADPADPGLFEFEAGVGYIRDADFHHWDFPAGLAYGAMPGLEIGLGFGGQFEERLEKLDGEGRDEHVNEEGLGDLTIGAKWQFLGESSWLPRQALAGAVKFPTADDDKGLGSGETDYDLTWVASKSLTDKMGAHVNAGYTWIGQPDGDDANDVVHYGLALDYQIADSLQWVGEVFAEKELQGDGDTVVLYNTGFRWSPLEALTLDAAAGSRLRGDAEDFAATVGLTWAFGTSETGNP